MTVERKCGFMRKCVGNKKQKVQWAFGTAGPGCGRTKEERPSRLQNPNKGVSGKGLPGPRSHSCGKGSTTCWIF